MVRLSRFKVHPSSHHSNHHSSQDSNNSRLWFSPVLVSKWLSISHQLEPILVNLRQQNQLNHHKHSHNLKHHSNSNNN